MVGARLASDRDENAERLVLAVVILHLTGRGFGNHGLEDDVPGLRESSIDLRRIRIQLAFDAAAALVALLVNTTLSVYKPRGLTKYGWRKQREQRAPAQP